MSSVFQQQMTKPETKNKVFLCCFFWRILQKAHIKIDLLHTRWKLKTITTLFMKQLKQPRERSRQSCNATVTKAFNTLQRGILSQHHLTSISTPENPLDHACAENSSVHSSPSGLIGTCRQPRRRLVSSLMNTFISTITSVFS